MKTIVVETKVQKFTSVRKNSKNISGKKIDRQHVLVMETVRKNSTVEQGDQMAT